MGLSFLRGLIAAVNPCGFVLLPTYLMYFLGMQGVSPGSQRATVRRALSVSTAVSAGFMSVFVIVGLISYHFTNWINEHAKYASVAIGVGLVALGLAMAAGYKLPLATPQIDGGGRSRTFRGMFLYGIAYAVASIGCTIGLFLGTLLSTRRDGIVAGVANVAAYGAGMALLVTALTVSLAVANTGLLRVLRGGMAHVDKIAAVFVVLSGVYLIYYFWIVDVNEDTDPITSRVEDLQLWITRALDAHWQWVAAALLLVVGAAVAFVARRREPSDDFPDDNSDEPGTPTAATAAPAPARHEQAQT